MAVFGDKNTKNVVLERATRNTWKASPMWPPVAWRGFVDVVKELETHFPDPTPAIEKEADKKAFAKLFVVFL